MQKPVFFDHQIVKPSDLDFISQSYEQAIDNNFTVFSDETAGLVSGFNLVGTTGSSQFSVYPGVAYNNAGERLQTYAISGVNISFTGTQTIYARLTTVNYDPNPATNPAGPANVVQSLNPDTNALVDTRSYGFCYIDSTGTSADVILGQVTADGSFKFVSSNSSGSQHIKIAGLIDVYDGTLSATTIATGTIDSNKFTNPLNYDIHINSGVNFLTNGSGSSNLGSPSNTFSNIYANTGTFHQINGMSPIIIDSLKLKPSASIESTSGKLLLDSSGNGVQFGGAIYTTQINAGISGNITLYTPSGNINLQPINGGVNIAGNLNSAGNFISSGSGYFANGLTIAGGTVDLSNTNLLLTNSSVSDNLLFNSDFSMGTPKFYTGTTIFNNSGTTNFKSGLTILSPWDIRYSGALAPFNWGFSGNNTNSKFLIGTSEPNTEAVGLDEKQFLTFTPTATTGTFNIVYTGIPIANWPAGPNLTGVTTALNFNVSAGGMQTALENLANIGSGNISVIGNNLSGYTLEFINNLGFKNMPQISISGSTLLSGISTVVPIINTTQQGYTPVFNALKDPTVYSGLPKLNHFGRVSGTSVTNVSGIYFTVPIKDSKPLTTYNLSLYYKNLVDDSSLNILATIDAGGQLASTGTYTQISKASNFGDWQRINTKLVSPDTTGTSQDLLFKLQSSGIAVNNVSIELAGVQLTEGPNLFPFSNERELQFRLYDPNGINAISAGGWTGPTPDAVNHLMYYTRTGAVGEKNILVTGSFYSPGGIATVSTQCSVAPGDHIYHSIAIDDKPVTSTLIRTPGIWQSPELSATQYVSKGKHNIFYSQVWGSATGGISYFNVSGAGYAANTFEGQMITAPKIDITFHG